MRQIIGLVKLKLTVGLGDLDVLWGYFGDVGYVNLEWLKMP